MPAKNWVTPRFRAEGGDDPNGAAEPQYIEVSGLDGLPVQIVPGGGFTPSWKYARPTSTATTTITVQAGVLHSIVINTTAAAAITVYDGPNASSPTIAVFQASAGLGTYLYDVEFADGLTFVLAGASDITVAWR